ncbi:hypothetical protein JW948_02205 [bacterium]|nr:hypothetical protein [bacterium]
MSIKPDIIIKPVYSYPYLNLSYKTMDAIGALIVFSLAFLLQKQVRFTEWYYFLPVLLMMPLLFTWICHKRKSPFERKYHLIKKCVCTSFAEGNIWFKTNYSLFIGLLIYQEGLELRVSCHCFYIPFAKMKACRFPNDFGGNQMVIESDLEDVPKRIFVTGIWDDVVDEIKKLKEKSFVISD